MKTLTQPPVLLAIPLLISCLNDPSVAAEASIGVNFAGGGANGAPTSLNRLEEAGVVPQADWNNFIPTSLTNALLRDSTHEVTAITLTYASPGVWGSGALDTIAGTTNGNAKLLNGFINAQPAGGAVVTFNGLAPDQTYSVVVYTLNEFSGESATYWFNEVTDPFEGALTILSEGAADWKASPQFRRVVDLGASGNFIRWDNVPPRPDGTLSVNVSSGTRGPVNGIQLISTNEFPPTTRTPAIVLQPRNVSVHPNESGTFRLVTDGPWSYQWYSNDVAIAGAISDSFTTVPLVDELGTRAQYTVVVSSGTTQITSESVHLILVPALPPGGIFYDAFNYPEGELGNWGEWTLQNIAQIASPGLSYSDGTNSLQVSGNAMVPPIDWDPFPNIPIKLFGTNTYGGPNSTVFMSFLFDFRNLNPTDNSGYVGVSAFEGTGDWGNERIFVGKVWCNNFISIDGKNPVENIPIPYQTNGFLVLRVTQDDAGAAYALYLNPPLTGLPETPHLTGSGGLVTFNAVGVNAGEWAGPKGDHRVPFTPPGPFVDEFRFGITYASVAPIQAGPQLTIERNGTSVTVRWPATDGYTLEMSDKVTGSTWSAAPAGNPVTLPIGSTPAFFRLIKP